MLPAIELPTLIGTFLEGLETQNVVTHVAPNAHRCLEGLEAHSCVTRRGDNARRRVL